MQSQPLVECAYGWGRSLRLYRDYLDVNGTRYALAELLHVRPMRQHAMGVASIRLELDFRTGPVVLRGLAADSETQKVIEYLTGHLSLSNQKTTSSLCHVAPGRSIGMHEEDTCSVPSLSSEYAPRQAAGRFLVPVIPSSPQPALPDYRPMIIDDPHLQEFAQALTIPMYIPGAQPVRKQHRERRLRRLRTERAMRERGFEKGKLVRYLSEGMLPTIPVPLRLLPGEYAHYSSEATLCREPLSMGKRYTYIAKDYGTLILTNERLIYIGRRSQIVLGYARLLHVSRLRGAIAFMADYWSRRVLFEMPDPAECTMFLECILQRFQERNTISAISVQCMQPDDPYLYHVYGFAIQ